MTREIINAVQIIVNEADLMRNAYFFSSPCSASSRRLFEKTHSHNMVVWEEGNHIYTAKYIVECSCRNVYARGVYTKDGKQTNLTVIKNSLKRMKANAE